MANGYRLKTTGPEDPQRIAEYAKHRYLRVVMTVNNTTFTSAPMTPRQFEEKLAGFGGLGFEYIEGLRKEGPTAGEWQTAWI
jgi:hypothetical protein